MGVRIAALRNEKARQWLEGRKTLFEELGKKIRPGDKIIWVHCASAGEFEQGKPVIEALKQHYPSYRILVSFFSPSGMSAARNYTAADIITYLPEDSPANAWRFTDLVKPKLAVFVKYEFWYNHLAVASVRGVPLVLISGIFRKDQAFFKWYGSPYRQVFFHFRHLFVQDQASLQLLKDHGITEASVGGDTRFDRVQKIAGNFTELDAIRDFAGSGPLIVAGSTWPEDESLLAGYIKHRSVKLIIAPHEIPAAHLQSIDALFPEAIRFSKWNKASKAHVLVIDNMGMLSRLYHYSTITYVGGGFNKSGIHNTLEAAVYGKPVVFGPQYQKFKEARELIEKGGAFSITDSAGLQKVLDSLLQNQEQLARASAAAKSYVAENTGATERFLKFIQENLLLTS